MNSVLSPEMEATFVYPSVSGAPAEDIQRWIARREAETFPVPLHRPICGMLTPVWVPPEKSSPPMEKDETPTERMISLAMRNAHTPSRCAPLQMSTTPDVGRGTQSKEPLPGGLAHPTVYIRNLTKKVS